MRCGILGDPGILGCQGGLGMDASTRFDTQIVGAMPVIAEFCDQIRLGKIIDQVVPWEGSIPLGNLVQVLVMNRLLKPSALFRVGEWADQAGVTDYFGVTAEQLNDDCL